MSKLVTTLEINALIEDIKHAREFAAAAKKREAELTQKLYNFMGENESLVNGETGQEDFVTWKYSKPRTIFNSALFQQEHRSLYEHYLKEGDPVRTLRFAK